jgi:transcriptional regulator with XRE-family HTH domain
VKFSDKLKTLRKSRQISLTKLSIESGVNKGYLSSLESGRQANPTLDIMSKLANTLDVELNYFAEDFNPQERHKKTKLPKGLKKFIEIRIREKNKLDVEDIDDLYRIEFRGKKEFSAQEYALFYAHLELSWKNKQK